MFWKCVACDVIATNGIFEAKVVSNVSVTENKRFKSELHLVFFHIESHLVFFVLLAGVELMMSHFVLPCTNQNTAI